MKGYDFWKFVKSMLRLSLLLGASVYAALIIVSETLPAPRVDTGPQTAAPDRTKPAVASARDRLVTEDGRHLPVAAVIAPANVAPQSDVALVSTRPATAVTVSASTGLPERPLVAVTGRYVNLRAGPSADAAVLTALAQGEQAEIVEADGSGWVRIRTTASGVEGYMADRFLSAVN